MVVRSGSESIVRYKRGFTVGLRVLAWVFILAAVVALGAAFLGEVTWSVALAFALSVYPVVGAFSIVQL